MYANVLKEACIRCGLCPSICPEVFSLPDDGESARAVTDQIPPAQQADVQTAADSCPTGAIVLR